MFDVTAIGELLIDFASLSADEEGYPTMAAHPGGAPANYLAALSTYGMKTAFLGKVGTDVFGELIIGTMKRAGIETKGIIQDDSVFTTLAFVTFDDHGERTFSFARKPGADTCLREEELMLSMIDQTKMFHFGTLSLTGEPVRSTTQKAVAYARNKGKQITFDPNLRLSLWNDPEEAKKQMLWGLAQADVVKISDEEIDFLWNCSERDGTAKIFETYGVGLVMTTLGSKGCRLWNQHGSVIVPAPVVKAVDTTGAGDIFGGSAVSRILNLNRAPEDLTAEEMYEIAVFATTAASLSTQKQGGIPSIPKEKEVLDFING